MIARVLAWLRWLVPRADRESWRREWLAEFAGAERDRPRAGMTSPPAWRAGRLWAAARHALWLRSSAWQPGAIGQDVRHGWRALRRRPAFTLAAVFTLAIGVAGTTVMFGTLRAVLWRPLPFADPGRLVLIGLVSPSAATVDPSNSVSPPDFADWRRDATTMAAMAAIRDDGYALTGDGVAEQVSGNAVTGAFFSVLGVPAALGRGLTEADDAAGAPAAAVLSDRLWRRRYGADRAIVGRRVTVDGVSREVVGVMPPSFDFPIDADLWTPLLFTTEDLTTQRGAHYLTALGRLRPSATLAGAKAEMAAIGGALAARYSRAILNTSVLSVVPLRSALVGDVEPPLRLVFGAVALVFLVACVNVASLVLGTAMSRQRDFAVRAALGAGRGRLVRGLLVESAILAGLGGVLGLGLASAGVRAVAAADVSGIVLITGTRIDVPVLAFALGMTPLAGVLSGLWPAWKLSRRGNSPDLTGAGVRTSSREASRARAVLVLAEVAAAVSLLVGAGLLARSFLGLTRVALGLDPDSVQTGSISLPDASYHDPDRRALFVQQVLARLSARGDVQSAAATFGLPLTSFSYYILVGERDGMALGPADRPSVEVRTATPKFFATIGTPVIAGRDFTEADRRGSAPVVIINQRAAALLWPRTDPIGHRVSIRTTLGLGRAHVGGDVVGVVGDIHDVSPAIAPRPIVYLSGLQCPMAFVKFVVKPRTDAAGVAGALRDAVSSVDPTIPVFAERPMRDVAARVVAQPRLFLQIVGLFAAVAIALAAVGIYGVMAESVRARSREIGIRLALGATSKSTVGLVLRQASWLALAGIGIGVAVALAESRLLAKFLFGIAPTDIATLAGVSGVTLAVALAAAWLPARRAARVDPVTTLRGGD